MVWHWPLTYDIVANCNIMLTNKVKTKDIMLHVYTWFRLIYIIFTMVSEITASIFDKYMYINERVDVNQDGPNLIIEAPPPPNCNS